MYISIKSDRNKRRNNNSFADSILPPVKMEQNSVQYEPEQEERKKYKVFNFRQRKIKQLTLINRQLIETLKKQNQEISKKISKQKLRGQKNRSTSVHITQDVRQLEKQKKELINVYKQIQMYKNTLANLKAKQISTDSVDKLKQISDRIKYEDLTIQKLQKQIKYLGSIKEQQQKELHILENHDIKTSVLQMQQQVKKLKQRLKNTKKRTVKMQQMGKKQHIYYIELEKTLRKHNQEHFQGKNEPKRQTKFIEQDIPERQWQIVKLQLFELKKSHEQHNKKIEHLTRHRNKEIKSCEQNQSKIKDKLRKLQSVKTKLEEVAKLVFSDKSGSEKAYLSKRQDGEGEEYQIVNGKKVYKTKNEQSQRPPKKWLIPQSYSMEKGKVLPDSIFFTDKNAIRDAKKSKIVQVKLWLDKIGKPCILQFKYMNQQNKLLEGMQVYPSSVLTQLDEKVIVYKEGDYVNNIRGRMNEGFLTSITFVSKFGKKEEFNPKGTGQPFNFDPRPNEIPSCFYGALVKNEEEDINICYIGCEFIEDW